MRHLPLELTERQIKRYTKKGILEEKLQELESFNETQKIIIENMVNFTDEEASEFMYKNRFGNIKGIDSSEDAKYFLSNQQFFKESV